MSSPTVRVISAMPATSSWSIPSRRQATATPRYMAPRDRYSAGPDRPTRRGVFARWRERNRVAFGRHAQQPSAGAQEVLGVGGALEAQEVRAQQTLDQRPAPRKLGEELDRRERDVVCLLY